MEVAAEEHRPCSTERVQGRKRTTSLFFRANSSINLGSPDSVRSPLRRKSGENHRGVGGGAITSGGGWRGGRVRISPTGKIRFFIFPPGDHRSPITAVSPDDTRELPASYIANVTVYRYNARILYSGCSSGTSTFTYMHMYMLHAHVAHVTHVDTASTIQSYTHPQAPVTVR